MRSIAARIVANANTRIPDLPVRICFIFPPSSSRIAPTISLSASLRYRLLSETRAAFCPDFGSVFVLWHVLGKSIRTGNGFLLEIQVPLPCLCEMADGRAPSKSGVNPIGIRCQHGHPSRDNPDAVLAAEFISDTART